MCRGGYSHPALMGREWICAEGRYSSHLDMEPGGGYSSPRHGTRGWVLTPSPLPLLTPSGSHHTYGRHAGGKYPTGMLSNKRTIL